MEWSPALAPAFLQEMDGIKPPLGTLWLILGDFNLTYAFMGQFRAANDEAELMELHVSNHRFS
jgi:hypothetical protein